MKKKRILFITNSLQKAGSEKYVYELVSHINKEMFDVEVLTTCGVLCEKDFPHYYYFKLIDKGIKIHTLLHSFHPVRLKGERFIQKIPLLSTLYFVIINQINRLRRKIKYEKELRSLFLGFNAIILIDALYYYEIKNSLPKGIYFETHLMCHQAQFKNDFRIYQAYEQNIPYNFVYIDCYQIKEIECQGKAIGNTFYLPLSINFSGLSMNANNFEVSKHAPTINIGVFTRINRIKPIENILEAFEILFTLNKNVCLRIFGKVQDDVYYNELNELIQKKGMVNCVSFEGHTNDMLKSIKDSDITLIWVVSIFDFVGYAAIEICLNNVPIVLCNIDNNMTSKLINDASCIPPYFYDYKELAIYTNNTIINGNIGQLMHKEKTAYMASRNLSENIKKYEDFLSKNLELNLL